MTTSALRAPFAWYGGKSRVAGEIWRRLGNPDYYIEPFAGSLACLLARPDGQRGRLETVNDADAFLTNFWRAARDKPAAVVKHSAHPRNKLEMQARHRSMQSAKAQLAESLLSNPTWCDPKLAGWWLHGICGSFGEAWLRRKYAQQPSMKLGGILLRTPRERRERMTAIAERLAGVRVCHGDWLSVLTPIQIGMRDRSATTGIVLDPPYAGVSVSYGEGGRGGCGMSSSVREWAIEHDTDPRLRIALCGYEGEHKMPDSWDCYAWASSGGLSRNKSHGTANRFRERIWFSPGCLS
jgi:DNA adenine methylase